MSKLSFGHSIAESLSRHGEKTGISYLREGRQESVLSYGELLRDARRMANYLKDTGVDKGDRVVLFLPKSLVFVVAHLGLQLVGAVAVPLNPGFKKSEAEYLIRDAEPKLILAGKEQIGLVGELDPKTQAIPVETDIPYQEARFFRSAEKDMPEPRTEAEDPGLIVYTSGTTGKPKGAILTQSNLIHDARNIIDIWEISEADNLCHALPLYHVHGLCFALHTALLAGSHIIMLDAFSAKDALQALSSKQAEAQCTLFMAVPTMYRRMMDHLDTQDAETSDFDHVRLWTSGSAPLLPKDFDRIKRLFGKEPVEREGMSETGMNFSNPLRGRRKPGSVGLPLPGLQARIVDPDTFEDTPAGQVGEIWLKSPSVTPGYWKKPEATKSTFCNGWFRTGDLGRVDEEGYYYLTDRIKHIIISGGENISPKEVESVINEAEQVMESSVVGIPDENWGEKVVAAVVPKPGSHISAQDILSLCRERLHRWKSPKEIRFLDELPKNTMGKVLKEKVRDLFLL